MITGVNNDIETLKNQFIEIFLDKTNKVSNVADGSILNATAFGVAKIAQKAMTAQAITEAKIFVDTATGDYLDKAAAMYGVSPRRGALGSSTYIRVFAAPGTVYDATNTFVNTNGIRFSVDQPLTVDITGYGYVGVRSINSGYVTNVAPNTIVSVTPQPQGHIECTNEYYAIGGRDSEDDETFRIRIKNNLNILSKGTMEYFTQVFQLLDDRVLKVMNVGLGENGMFEIYLVTQNGILFTQDELDQLLIDAKSYFGIFELNLNGNVVGIVLKNAVWFFIGSDRGIDFRIKIDPAYSITEVRQSIQIGLTKYLDFRFWEAGKTVQWDDLLDIVKKTKGVKYVPDEFFFPFYDEAVPTNQLPRIRGFVMRDEKGAVLYDSGSNLSPLFYTRQSNEDFRGLTDNSLSLTQLASFTLVDLDTGKAIEGARITVGNISVLTNKKGEAAISLVNGTYTYTISKTKYSETIGTFVIINAPVFINESMEVAPWNIVFSITDEKSLPIEGAAIFINGKDIYTNSSGRATTTAKNGTYPYTITKLGYDQISGKSVVISEADANVSAVMYLKAWDIILTTQDSNARPLPGVTINLGSNSYITGSNGSVKVGLVNGEYTAKLSKTGYIDTTEKFIVLNSPDSKTFKLANQIYNVDFTVTDLTGTTPIAGAVIRIIETGVSSTTNANGEASLTAINGEYSYSITSSIYDTYSGTFSVVNEDVSLQARMDLRHFDVTISVVDDIKSQPIVGANVTINSKVSTTDSRGEITLSLQNGTYPFSVVKIGYINATGSVVVLDQNKSQVVQMTLQPYENIFQVTDDSDVALAGVNININAKNLTTDASGQASIVLVNGTYQYTATKLGYESVTNSLIVANQAKVTNVRLSVIRYEALFTITGKNGVALAGASIKIGSQTIVTNAGGIASFNLLNGTYSYAITCPGYSSTNGEVVINYSDVSLPVQLTPLTYQVSIVVKDTAATPLAIADATVTVDGKTLTTNAQGTVTTSLESGNYTVLYSKAGYQGGQSNINVTKIETFNISMPKIYQLSFSVNTSTREPIEGATVIVRGAAIIDSPKTLTTNASGVTPSISVINGGYTYDVAKTGYSPQSGSGTINNANASVTPTLTFGFETTFVIKEGTTPISGVDILIDSITQIITDSTGTAKIFLSTGVHTVDVSKTGYLPEMRKSVTVGTSTQTVNYTLTKGSIVTFNTEDENGGVSAVTISLVKSGVTTTLTTQANGSISEPLEIGSYTYTAAKTGYVTTTSQNFTVTQTDQTVTINLTNNKLRTVNFITNPVTSGVSIVIDSKTITTASNGQAAISFVKGSYLYTATKTGFKSLTGTVVVNDSASINVNLAMVKISTITVRVFEKNTGTTPIAGANVILKGYLSITESFSQTTPANGIVYFGGIINGSWGIEIPAFGVYKANSKNIVVSGDASYDMLLEGTVSLTFTVKNTKTTNPINGAKVYIYTGNLLTPQTKYTDTLGVVLFDVTPGVAYIYEVSAQNYESTTGVTPTITSNAPVLIGLRPTSAVLFNIRENTSSGKVLTGVLFSAFSAEGGSFGGTVVAGQTAFNGVDTTYYSDFTLSGYETISQKPLAILTTINPRTFEVIMRKLNTVTVTVKRAASITYTKNVASVLLTELSPLSLREVRSFIGQVEFSSNKKTVIEKLLDKMKRYAVKKTRSNEVTICELDQNNSNKFFDGSVCDTTGKDGDIMVLLPETFYEKDLKAAPGMMSFDVYEENPHAEFTKIWNRSLIGAYKLTGDVNKVRSVSGKAPLTGISFNDVKAYAENRGEGYGLINYNQHCQMAYFFYSKYLSRDAQSKIGIGGATVDTLTGETNLLGNNDSVNENDSWVNFQGVEGVFGGCNEFIQGVHVDGDTWIIEDETVREVKGAMESGFIASIAAEKEDCFDLIPTFVGGTSKTYYCDGYKYKTDASVVIRSGFGNGDECGMATIAAEMKEGEVDAKTGSRLAFTGNIVIIEDVEAFRNLQTL